MDTHNQTDLRPARSKKKSKFARSRNRCELFQETNTYQTQPITGQNVCEWSHTCIFILREGDVTTVGVGPGELLIRQKLG